MALLITDPVVYKRLPNGDMKFPREFARGNEAVAIGVRTRVGMMRGEWFLNLLRGLPLLPTADGIIVKESESILGNQYNPVAVRAAVLTEILDTPGVITVPVLRTRYDNPSRNLAIACAIRTLFSDTPEDLLQLAFNLVV